MSATPIDRLRDLLADGGVVVLSGAGLSTESGIPDYRGPSGAALRRHAPMTYQAFRRDPRARHRYWARSHLGWPTMRDAQPNDGHRAVAAWEQAGLVTGVITQNVDGLHQKAGSRAVVDLHGRLDRVACLDCRMQVSRDALHARVAAANPAWAALPTITNPDGDVELPDDAIDSFTMLDCTSCGGALKPDVVYFGESVPADRVERCYAMVDQARSVLVLGSSLTVYSGRRFVMRAQGSGIPVAVVNQGPTRADDVAAIRVAAPLGVTLTALTATPTVPA